MRIKPSFPKYTVLYCLYPNLQAYKDYYSPIAHGDYHWCCCHAKYMRKIGYGAKVVPWNEERDGLKSERAESHKQQPTQMEFNF